MFYLTKELRAYCNRENILKEYSSHMLLNLSILKWDGVLRSWSDLIQKISNKFCVRYSQVFRGRTIETNLSSYIRQLLQMSKIVGDVPSRRDTILEKVRQFECNYLNLDKESQSDREICLATLSAFGRHSCNDSVRVLERIWVHMPHFSDHEDTFLRLLEQGNFTMIGIYDSQFGPAIYDNRDLLRRAINRDHSAYLFERLPTTFRSDPELLKLAVESVDESCARRLVSCVSSETWELNESTFLRARERFKMSYRAVPAVFWCNRTFVLEWLVQGNEINLSMIPKEFNNDKELCLSLFRSGLVWYSVPATVKWISQDLLGDKEFVLECLGPCPSLLEFCTEQLQNDFDVLLEAANSAIRSTDFMVFVHHANKSLITFVQLIISKTQAYHEFTTFVACIWKSRQLHLQPLNALNCGDETARGLKTMVSEYLGYPMKVNIIVLERIFDEIVSSVVLRATLSTALVPIIPSHLLAQAVIKAIDSKHYVKLREFPDELWSSRTFVKWAGRKGIFCDAISEEFSADSGICYEFYLNCPTARGKIVQWISNSLKADRSFVLQCIRIDSLMLNFCSSDLRYDFELFFTAAQSAIRVDQVDAMMKNACENNWADSVVSFATSLRLKVEAHRALQTFLEQADGLLFEQGSGFIFSPEIGVAIGSYLGIDPSNVGLAELIHVLNNHLIYFLALGGDIDKLCEARSFLPMRKARSRSENSYFYNDDDDYDEDDY